MEESSRVPTSMPLSGWLAELAQPSGAPGGGAASGVMIGLGAALLRMVAEYTQEDAQASACADRLSLWRAEALEATEADGVCSAEFGAALALSPDDPDREERVRDAAMAAARSSVLLGRVGQALLPELQLLAAVGDPGLRADLAVAAEAVAAGIGGATINLRANLQTARKHGAPAAVVAEYETDIRSLAFVKRAAAAIAEAASGHFDR